MDDIREAANALRALANDSSKVTKKTARLRQLLPEIDALQAAGVTHEAILEALNKNGFDLKMGAYSTMLWRIRNKPKHPTSLAPASPVITGEPIGEGSSTPIPGAEMQDEEIDLAESRKRREAKASKFIGTDANPLITKKLKGNSQ